jgi:hypothetical protein
MSLVGSDEADRERATLVADRLAARRLVRGEAPEWWVFYERVDTVAAMELCETELTELDPRWFEILDFEALPSHPLREAEFG